MRKNTSLIAALAVTATAGSLLAVSLTQAQTSSSKTGSTASHMGTDQLGKQIATSGAPDGVTACVSCHGAQGEGNAAANFPRIAGQPPAYLSRQLKSYADGRRDNPVMGPIAKALTPDQMEAVAIYYSTLDANVAVAPPPTVSAQVKKRGQQLATIGDDKIGVQGCVNCHGPNGIGEAPSYPYLAAQHNAYLVASIQTWKSSTRRTDSSQQMNMIAKRLSDEDINALAAYYASQPAPLPLAQRSNIPRVSSARNSGESSAASSPAPAQGVGTEQGGPTSGGNQGPGGGGGASGSGRSGAPGGEAR